MNDIFDLFIHKCPICGENVGTIEPNRFYDYCFCENNCFTIDECILYFFDNDEVYFNIFKDEAKIINEINYWKENDRYLMKILTK